MILHPGIWALLVGAGLVLIMVAAGSGLGLRIMSAWDFTSSSESQLSLERRTYLVSSMVGWALLFELVSVLLFIYTVDDIHPLFVGAMCATGTLNANPIGWYVLALKIAFFFLAGLWVAINAMDEQAADYPLIRLKYLLLLILLPLAALDFILLITYFTGLNPEIITSCCGSLFSEAGSGLASELAGLPLKPMLWLFYLTAAAFVAALILARRHPGGLIRYLLALLNLAWLAVALAAIVSFISLYIYEIPTHHCPFDMFQKNYSFIGYPLYASLFAGVYFGLLPGLFACFAEKPSLTGAVRTAEAKWLALSLIFTFVFLVFASWPLIFGQFTMQGYY